MAPPRLNCQEKNLGQVAMVFVFDSWPFILVRHLRGGHPDLPREGEGLAWPLARGGENPAEAGAGRDSRALAKKGVLKLKYVYTYIYIYTDIRIVFSV